MWDKNEQDTRIDKQCKQQLGYQTPAVRYHEYCAGQINHTEQCCFCFNGVYPTFVYEEMNTNMNRDFQSNWDSHLSLLNLSRYNQNQINSYINQNSPGRSSYYFCMEPRNYSIPVHQMSKNILRSKHILNDKQQLALISGKFGYNNMFQEQVTSACKTVDDAHLFDFVHCHYDDQIFFLNYDTDIRFERHRRYRYNQSDDSARGGGFWFHKSMMIRYYMDLYKDNDYILYSDVDILDKIEPLGLYKTIETMVQRNADIALEIQAGPEHDWTKEDVLVAFNASSIVRQSPQAVGGIQFVRNSPRMRQFYDALVDCNANYHMISDEPSVVPNQNKGFYDHRHDQSILSLFYKTFLSNQTVIGPPVQTYFHLNRYTFQLYDTTTVRCPF